MSMTIGRNAPEDPIEVLEIPEDKELVLAFKRGEDGSYQAIYERYVPRVSGICRRMLDHSHDAEEAQQETFMRVYTALPRFNGRYQLGAWVSRIATNVCLDHIRSKGRKPADCVSHEMLVDLSSDAEDNVPEEELLKGDERQRVRETLATLAPNHRAALALREFEGMSYGDIAVALNMTEPQVKALIHRARKAFKKQWAPGLAAFLPWRFLARVRRFSTHYDTPTQISDAATSTVHFATSCSMALQQCGQFVTERVATTVTALVIGTAAVGVALAPSGDARSTERLQQDSAVNHASGERFDDLALRARIRTKVKKEKASVAGKVDEPPPASEPQPAPSPTSAPEPEPTSPPAEHPAGEPKPPPSPVYTYFGWTGEQAIPRAQASSSSSTVDCTRSTARHQVQTTISYSGSSYPLALQFEITGTTARMSFSVRKDGSEFSYSSWGATPVAAWSRDGSAAHVEITGEYGSLYGYEPESAKLPKSGTFDATLTLDCAAQTVLTEGTAFSTE